MTPIRRFAAAALALHVGAALAHDTWFEPLPSTPGEQRLSLGTGTQFPRYDSGIDMRYLVAQGCRSGAGAATTPLVHERDAPTALIVHVAADRPAATCWAQLTPFEIDLPADKIPIYLDEIQASDAIRAAWGRIAARGLPWHERYTKHARIELGGPAAEPVPMAMDLLLEGPPGPVHVGDLLHFRVLRDGQPLAGQPIQLRGDVLPLGIWRRTDGEGRAQVPAPAPGHWILRGVDLRPSATAPDTWDSRFITLAFEILPAAPRPTAAASKP